MQSDVRYGGGQGRGGRIVSVPKKKRIKDLKAIKKAKKSWCELCGNPYYELQIHHIKTRATSGGDVSENLICLCTTCHTKAHAGQVDKETLIEIVAKRECVSVEEVKEIVWGLKV